MRGSGSIWAKPCWCQWTPRFPWQTLRWCWHQTQVKYCWRKGQNVFVSGNTYQIIFQVILKSFFCEANQTQVELHRRLKQSVLLPEVKQKSKSIKTNRWAITPEKEIESRSRFFSRVGQLSVVVWSLPKNSSFTTFYWPKENYSNKGASVFKTKHKLAQNNRFLVFSIYIWFLTVASECRCVISWEDKYIMTVWV